MRTRLLLACSLFSLAAYLRMRHGSSTLAELRLASPARAPPTKFLVLMMKGHAADVAAMARDPAGWAPQPPWGAHALTSPESRGAAVAAARTDGAGFSCDVDRCHTP